MENAFAPITPATPPPTRPPATTPTIGVLYLRFTPYSAGSDTPERSAPIPAEIAVVLRSPFFVFSATAKQEPPSEIL